MLVGSSEAYISLYEGTRPVSFIRRVRLVRPVRSCKASIALFYEEAIAQEHLADSDPVRLVGPVRPVMPVRPKVSGLAQL